MNFSLRNRRRHRRRGRRRRLRTTTPGEEISPVCVPLSFLSDEIKSRITERNKHADIIIRIQEADKVAPLSFKVPRCLRG